MDNRDIKKQTDSDKTTYGVLSEDSHGNVFTNLQTFGCDVGIKLVNSYNNEFQDTKIFSPEGIRLICNLSNDLQHLPIDEKLKDYIKNSVKDIAFSKDKPTALENYTKLMSSLSDHVTVLTPVLPLLLQLSTHFC
ncbi:TPA: hypothetical protein RHY09_001152 [Escherichia coli]|nr:hypothetical protein [Escherichia coli]EHS0230691.1 hypothetical protein [Escherichia coli]EIW8248618.1 hypothetical protein [Escherichia coli]HDV1336401.1 hypothetical protein [Escherichia coli]HDV1355230.1 hypothetical protein [Escherichia coli]